MASLDPGLGEPVALETPQEAPVTLVRTPFVSSGSPSLGIEANEFRRDVRDHIVYSCAKDPREVTDVDLYQAFALTVRDRLVHRWLATQRTYLERDVKRAYYLSSEFLTGRSLGLCLLNLNLYGVAERMADEYGHDLGAILEAEGDPGLGNGGLGRLAACFMDSLATLELPAAGYGIRYEFGIFEQRIEGGQQVEWQDNWLSQGNPWELPRQEDAQNVKFYGRTEMRRGPDGRLRVEWLDAQVVVGLPFDSFIVGHRTDTVNTLRLWAARAARDFDLQHFNSGDYRRAVEEKIDTENISKVLYPNDHTDEGKLLRLKQQYFFVACSIADIVKRYKRNHSTFDAFPAKVAMQLNDTHPAIAVAELMRVLVDQEGLDWDAAWAITQSTFGYTNHTLLPEALERWPLRLFGKLLPRHLEIIFEINGRFLRAVHTRWPGDLDRLRRMSIIEEGPTQMVRMAHLATVGSKSINGVAKLHSELVQRELLADFHGLWPERFNNKTNGVTPRRWMLYANPRLTRLITHWIGSGWIDKDLDELVRLEAHADHPDLLEGLWAVKQANKRGLAALIKRTTGVELPRDAMFVVQVKRVHEYKRQVLACLQIIAHYLELKRHPEAAVVPRAYIFAGKAASGYLMAKLHIRLLNDVATVINSDPAVRGKLAVVFMPNYGVTLAQSIIPGADLSVQISTAGKEASGTSNMKLAMNGALTIGTLDGANVEIRDEVGAENFFLFGLHAHEVAALRPHYDPSSYIARTPALAEVLSLLGSGFFSFGEIDRYRPIVDQLRHHDPYLVCADFAAHGAAEAEAAEAYQDKLDWSRRALRNIIGARKFSSDATIRQYAREIWGIESVKVDPALLDGQGRVTGSRQSTVDS
jgi:starch phosphorylase